MSSYPSNVSIVCPPSSRPLCPWVFLGSLRLAALTVGQPTYSNICLVLMMMMIMMTLHFLYFTLSVCAPSTTSDSLHLVPESPSCWLRWSGLTHSPVEFGPLHQSVGVSVTDERPAVQTSETFWVILLLSCNLWEDNGNLKWSLLT